MQSKPDRKSSSMKRRDFLRTCGVGAVAVSSAHWQPAVGKTLTPVPERRSGSQGRDRTTVLEDVGGWVATLRYEDLPAEVVGKAKRVLLDTLGCALGAVDAPPVRMAQRVAALEGGKAQASVIGAGGKVSCQQAAFLNGMAIRYLDYNDYAALGSPHHCSINVAPALAVAEMQGLTGKDLLLGIVVAYEVQLRLRDATETRPAVRGWDMGTMATAYAAAAASAKLLGLDAAKIAYAMAIAGAHGNTLAEVRGAALASGGAMTPSKGTADPMSARLGAFAALLAREGLTYPLTMIEGTAGYGKVIAGRLDEQILRRRSSEFEIRKSCFKIWPCFVFGQAPIAVALELHGKKVVPEDIESVTVGVSADAYENQKDYTGEITAREHADHSVPYVVARALLDGQVTVDDFDERRFREPRAVELVKKVTLRSDPSLSGPGREAYGVKIEARLRNGSALRAELPAPAGSIGNPADETILGKKFLALAEEPLGRQRAVRAIEAILSTEKMVSLGGLLEAVTAPGNAG